MIEFLIHECRRESEATVVTGVVNAGSVKIGTVFDCVSQESVTQTVNGRTLPVRLAVAKIVAYGHQIDDLPEGMTGELSIEGEGADKLHHGHFLSSA